MRTFNLFDLHQGIDKHPRSWICVRGNSIRETINEIEKEIITEKALTRESISKILAKKLNISFNSFKYLLRGKSEYYPIPFVLELVQLCENKDWLNKIHSKIEYLKVNSASSKEVKAIKSLTPDLCKILGAFMADGSLTVTFQLASKNKDDLKPIAAILKENGVYYNEWNCKSRAEFSLSFTINQNNYDKTNNLISNLFRVIYIQSHYNIELTDEHKSSVEAFKNWFLSSFNVMPESFKENKDKSAWRVVYSSKILARYFMVFFGIVPGEKTYTAFEPSIIESSALEMRKLFARGVLMFDGSFTSAGKLCFSSKSKILFESIKDILKKDGVDIGITSSRGNYVIFTYNSVSKEKIQHYFEKGTQKWLRVEDCIITRQQTISEISKKYRIYSINKVTFEKLYNLMKEVRSCDLDYLANQFKCSRSILLPYLTVLAKNGLVKISLEPKSLYEEYLRGTPEILLKEKAHKLLFDKIKDSFGTFEKFGKVTNIHKATISTWKLRKHRLPLFTLKRICDLCNLNFSFFLTNVEKTSKRIIEFTSDGGCLDSLTFLHLNICLLRF